MFRVINSWRHFLDRSNEDPVKVFGVAVLTALFSAVLVSVATVTLKPMQEANLAAERAVRMAAMLDTLPGMRDLMAEAGVDTLQTRLVDLSSGEFVDASDASAIDLHGTEANAAQSILIPPELDVAGLDRRAMRLPVHLMESDGDVQLIVLPITGKGYQSTLRANLALQADLNTIAALSVVEQGETPGLGARILDPDWQDLWSGKEITDAEGRIVIAVVQGPASGLHEVDAISGATITSNGVANMLRYWLGDHGYGPLIDRLRREGL